MKVSDALKPLALSALVSCHSGDHISNHTELSSKLITLHEQFHAACRHEADIHNKIDEFNKKTETTFAELGFKHTKRWTCLDEYSDQIDGSTSYTVPYTLGIPDENSPSGIEKGSVVDQLIKLRRSFYSECEENGGNSSELARMVEERKTLINSTGLNDASTWTCIKAEKEWQPGTVHDSTMTWQAGANTALTTEGAHSKKASEIESLLGEQKDLTQLCGTDQTAEITDKRIEAVHAAGCFDNSRWRCSYEDYTDVKCD